MDVTFSQNKFDAVMCRGDEHTGHSGQGCLLWFSFCSFFFFALGSQSGGSERATARHSKIVTSLSLLTHQLSTVPSLCAVAAGVYETGMPY